MKTLIYLATFLFTSIAQGAVLVDTGHPSTNNGTYVCKDSTQGLYCNQSIALKINLTEAVSITDIKSYFIAVDKPGDLTMALYSNLNNIPGQELYSSAFTVAGYDWYGLSNLNWNVTAGDYWVSFEVRAGQTFYGAISTYAPRPLEAALTFNYGQTWTNIGTYKPNAAGLVVEGISVTPVAEPESYALLLTGFALIGFAARRKSV
jgi:hypothetical protein